MLNYQVNLINTTIFHHVNVVFMDSLVFCVCVGGEGLRHLFYGRHNDLMNRYGVYVSLITTDMFHFCHNHNPVFSSFMFYHRAYTKSNTTGTTSGAGTYYTSGEPEFTLGYWWGSRCSIFSFLCICCKSLFVLLYFFLWPLCCLSFYYLQILITPFVSCGHCVVYHSTIYRF